MITTNWWNHIVSHANSYYIAVRALSHSTMPIAPSASTSTSRQNNSLLITQIARFTWKWTTNPSSHFWLCFLFKFAQHIHQKKRRRRNVWWYWELNHCACEQSKMWMMKLYKFRQFCAVDDHDDCIQIQLQKQTNSFHCHPGRVHTFEKATIICNVNRNDNASDEHPPQTIAVATAVVHHQHDRC